MLLSLLWGKSFTQSQSELDSLFKIVSNLPEDTTKLQELDQLVKLYSRVNPDSALYYANMEIDLARKLQDDMGIGLAAIRLGIIYKRTNRFDIAEEYYHKALDIYDRIGYEKGKADVLNNLGTMNTTLSNYEKALDYFFRSMKHYQNSGNDYKTPVSLMNIGVVFKEMDDDEQALIYYKQALEKAKELNQPNTIIKCNINIGGIYRNSKEYSLALKNYRDAEKMLQEYRNIYDLLKVHHNIGTIYEDQERWDEALDKYKLALSLSERLGSKYDILLARQGIGNILIKKGDTKKGIEYLESSLEIAEEIGQLYRQKELSYNLYKIYNNLGNYEKALNYHEQFAYFNDTLFNLNRIKQIDELQEQYETEKKEQQIAILEKDNALKQSELSRKKLVQYFLLVVSSIFALFAAYYGYNATLKRRKNKLLEQQNSQISSQKELIDKQNKELVKANRTKDRMFQIIAHDLRSPLVSLDNFAKLIPIWIEEKDYDALSDLSEAMETSLARIVTLVDNLLNWAMSMEGEIPYHPQEIVLKRIGDETVGLYKSFASLKKIDLSSTIEDNLIVHADQNILRTVLRNLVNNAVKFTPENGNIDIGAQEENGSIKVWVKDTGVGIDTDKWEKIFEIASSEEIESRIGKGLGLFFCKEFVKINKGEISLQSNKGVGTTFYFTVPSSKFSN